MGNGKCSIRDVAEYVGVAPSTVSRVLNNRMNGLRVTEETRKRILNGARELSYTPNIHAKRLFSSKSGVIALVLPAYELRGQHVFRDFHLNGLFTGLELTLAETEYRMLVVFNDRRFIAKREYLSLFREGSIDGMLVWGGLSDEEYWNDPVEEGFPILFLSRPPENGEFNYVMPDYENAGHQALVHLTDKGHRKIGWINGFAKSGPACGLQCGIFADVPDGVTIYSTNGNYSLESGRTLTHALLDEHPGITALLAANLWMAKGALVAAEERGLRVPEDFACIACDYTDGDMPEELTRIWVHDQPLAEKGAKALFQLISKPKLEIRELAQAMLVQGTTT